MDVLGGLEVEVRVAALYVVRVLAAVSLIPVFGTGAVARYSKLAIGLHLGLIAAFANGLQISLDPGPQPIALGLAMGREFLVGIGFGFAARFWFEVCKMVGSLVSQEMGLNLANQVDPTTPTPVPLIGFYYETIGLALYFATGGQRSVATAVVRSFEALPPGRFSAGDRHLDALLAWSSGLMEASIRVAAPIFVVLVLTSIMIGLLAKVAPQWHLLDASYPIRAGAALLLLALLMPLLGPALERVFELTNRHMDNFVAAASG